MIAGMKCGSGGLYWIGYLDWFSGFDFVEAEVNAVAQVKMEANAEMTDVAAWACRGLCLTCAACLLLDFVYQPFDYPFNWTRKYFLSYSSSPVLSWPQSFDLSSSWQLCRQI